MRHVKQMCNLKSTKVAAELPTLFGLNLHLFSY